MKSEIQEYDTGLKQFKIASSVFIGALVLMLLAVWFLEGSFRRAQDIKQTMGEIIATSQPTLMLVPTEAVEQQKGEDLYDTLLLHHSADIRNSDINFCKVSEYYGLRCQRLDLATTPLTDELLRDPTGQYYKAIAINAYTLERPGLLDTEEIALLRNVSVNAGVNLLVSEIADDASQADHVNLKALTDGEVLGAVNLTGSRRAWTISGELPEITREFTGQTLPSPAELKSDFSLNILKEANHVVTLVSSIDEVGTAYAVLARFQSGLGSVFLDSGSSAPLNLDTF